MIVNDEGEHVDVVKTAVQQMSQGVDGAESVLAFTTEKEADIETLFNDKSYYTAFVIPTGYNDALTHAVENKQPATLKVYLNQGYNTAITALTALVNQMSQQYSTTFIAQLGDKQIAAADATVLANPIVAQDKIYNAIATKRANGSAPLLMAMPAWIGALIGGFIVFLAIASIVIKERLNRSQVRRLMSNQLLFGIIIALFSGFTVATIGTIVGIAMPSYLFVSFAAFCFYLLVSAVPAWIGKPAITLFMVVMLLGMGVIMMPPEMLPDFFVNFVRPWIPIRFAAEGLRDIFYFESGFYTGHSFNVIAGIGIVGLIVFVLSGFKRQNR